MRLKLLKRLLPKIPTKLRTASRSHYEVLFIESFSNPLQVGECRPDNKQIIIKSSLTDKEKLSCFIHESIHAVNFEYEIGLTETQVLKLETAIMKVADLNKLFELLGKLC